MATLYCPQCYNCLDAKNHCFRCGYSPVLGDPLIKVPSHIKASKIPKISKSKKTSLHIDPMSKLETKIQYDGNKVSITSHTDKKFTKGTQGDKFCQSSTKRSAVKIRNTEYTLKESDYFIDDSGYYTYLLLNGNVSQKEYFEKLLSSNNYQVLLSGKSFRPASNNRQFDWYIRLSRQDGKLKPDLEALENLLKPLLSSSKTANLISIEKVKSLQNEIDRLAKKLVINEKKIKQDKKKIDNLEKFIVYITSENNRQSEYILELQKNKNKTERSKKSGNEIEILKWDVENLDSQNKQLKAALDSTKAELDRVNTDTKHYIEYCDGELIRKDDELLRLQQQVNDQANKLTEIQESPEISPLHTKHCATKPLETFANTMKRLLPKIVFHKDSIENIYYADEERIFNASLDLLSQLSNGKHLRGSKKLLNEVHEKYIPNSDDPRSKWRLYWKKTSDGGLYVLFKPKKEQQKDLEYIKKNW